MNENEGSRDKHVRKCYRSRHFKCSFDSCIDTPNALFSFGMPLGGFQKFCFWGTVSAVALCGWCFLWQSYLWITVLHHTQLPICHSLLPTLSSQVLLIKVDFLLQEGHQSEFHFWMVHGWFLFMGSTPGPRKTFLLILLLVGGQVIPSHPLSFCGYM